jgi:serpin B
VLLPRFRIEGRFELRAALEQLGLGKMFSDAADFMAIDGGKGALRVDQVVHRTFIEVGEKGTEAAAATAVVARAGAARTEPILVAADHPFAYQLVDLRTGFVLFTGRVADPRPSGP